MGSLRPAEPCHAQLTQPFPSETSRDSPDSSEELQTCHFISGGSEAEAPIQQTFPEHLRRAGWALAGAETQRHPAEAPCGGSGGRHDTLVPGELSASGALSLLGGGWAGAVMEKAWLGGSG